jgi:poly(A) polymerase Pap1
MPKKCGLYIFGSYKLGASSSDGDIDAVCVVPQYVNR